MSKVYDVFISYRRSGGFELAKLLNDRLTYEGYTVSFDLDTLREGPFDKELLKRIEQCSDFLVIVDKHAFDKIVFPAPNYEPEKDWMRVEIVYALQLKRNVIPIILEEASFPIKLPKDLEELNKKNGPKYSKDYFDRFYERLKEFLHSIPRNPTLEIVSTTTKPANLKIKTDLDCTLYLDGEEKMTLKADKIGKLLLAEGEYVLDFISLENETDRLEKTFEMPQKDVVLHIKLAEKRAIRLEKEAARQKQQKENIIRKRKRKRISGRPENKLEIFLQDQTFIVNGISFIMKPIEGGIFQMGSDDSDALDDERPIHSVRVSSFYMGETQVTQALWKAVMNSNPSCFMGDIRPVERVSWNDCQEFIYKLNEITGKIFRLPNEAEWEYAARGGQFNTGYKYAGSDSVDEVAWYYANSGNRTFPVKLKWPNELGLYDMSGNVWEWCQDLYGSYHKGSLSIPEVSSTGFMRVLRGGSWNYEAKCCQVSYRGYSEPSTRINRHGLRLVLSQ